MPNLTATYEFNLPIVGGDNNTWGGFLNSNWEKVDDLFDGSVSVDGIDIIGGAINGTPIGASTASTGVFTTLTATSVDLNAGAIDGTVIGASTRAAGSFTTVTTTTNVNIGGVALSSNGSAGAPAYSFTGDTDSGMFRGGAGTVIAHEGNGIAGFQWDGSFGQVVAYVGGGTTAPAYSFGGDLDTGFSANGANLAQIVCGGNSVFQFGAGPATVRSSTVAGSVSAAAANVYIDSSTGSLFRSTSSGRYKTDRRAVASSIDVEKLQPALIDPNEDAKCGQLIDALVPKSFKSTHEYDHGRRLTGFIAEEVAEVFPEASVDGGENYDVRALVAVLWDEVRSLRKRVAALESKKPETPRP